MRVLRQILTSAAWLACLHSGFAFADDPAANYLARVKPLLKGRCYACHGALKQEAGLRLDTASLIHKGGDSGAAIAPGDQVSTSLLLQRVSSTDVATRMPPEHEGEPFKPEEIELLKHWIAAGAPAPPDEQPETDPKDHWAFRAVVRPAEPAVKNTAWVRNPIDAWISNGHEQHGLSPQPEASRSILLRRLSMDLIGLPPTAEELAVFEADTSPNWYENAVERLLDDPRHGERWARHWMDVWRYSDWWGLGAQLRNSQKHMWHWRDWIVESLNADVPYDEMVRLMLAADELAPEDPGKLRATGFLARNYYIFNRTSWMDDVVTHVSKGLLGLTVNCAKCHDHKFDPITQQDFYRMRAFFEPYHVRLDMVPGETSLDRNGIPRVFDGRPETPTYLFTRGDEAAPDQSKPISPGIPDLLAFDDLDIKPVDLPESSWKPGLQPWVLANHRADATRRLKAAEDKRDQLVKQSKPSPTPAVDTPPVIEMFAALDETLWAVNGTGWSQQAGKVEQKQDGQVSSTLTLLAPAPQDFDAHLRFQLLGGSRWRSVILRFDVDPALVSGSGEVLEGQQVYLSGATSDSKLQGSFIQAGKSHYPADARKPFVVEVGKEYTLQVQARGTLINASVNGRHVLSWRTPVARRAGAVQISTFDALAVFHEFKLSPLDASVSLLEPNGSPALPLEEELALAESDVRVAKADWRRLELQAAAVRAGHEKPEAQAQEANVAAIRAERELEVEKARHDLLMAEQSLKRAPDDKRADAEKKLESASATLKQKTETLQAAVQPTDQFTPPEGAKWTATRFDFTGKDDPEVAFARTSTGRRSALARWITDRRNPLTARVAVNHLWNRHFGTPLVATPFDLGRNTPDPTHPELIDWLASELMDNQWSMKHLHRLIVTSATYRMSSTLAQADEKAARDPDNRYWWRRTPIRIESQAVRDAILSLAGTLDPTIGGPSVPTNEQEASKRRSLYFFHSNNDRNLFLTMFDEADVTECYRREQSVVPQQALALTNSAIVIDSSRQIADRIAAQSNGDVDFINRAFMLILAISPREAEIAASRNSLDRWSKVANGSPEQARANLVWILLNHNDFVTLR
ncbi:Planctomycete cytochrome C [Caulifigura coniformis]|uniref:Planctomycete cytochrome C n=1 Tax=Caulifigura coniformis TaxID=2527983 RepID=A0A517SC75_9PLAN|nr:DUF1553 domain-containing protein [Caulifigura coniformis]QDT53740.1 Planctomycete cytochrome C [Caulifigura coniformis]